MLIGGTAVFGAALLTRLLYLFLMGESPYHDVTLLKGTDCFVFYEKALKIASGEDVSEGVYYQAPLYPHFIALLFKIFGDAIQTGQRLFQFLLGSATAVMVFYMGHRLRGVVAGIMAGVLAALYGPLLFYEGAFLRAGPITFLNTLLVLLLFTGTYHPGRWKALAVGAVFGLSVLLKPNILIMLPVLVYWWRDSSRGMADKGHEKPSAKIKTYAAVAVFMVLGFVTVMSPLWVRNIKAGVDVFAVSRRGALEFVEGNHPDSPAAGWRLSEPVMEITVKSDRKLLPAIANTLELYKDRPLQFAAKQLDKTLAFLSGFEAPNNLNYYVEKRYVPLFRFLPAWPHLLGIFILGLWFSRKTFRLSYPLYAYVVLYSLATIAFYFLGRFRLPVVPVLCVFGGAGFCSLVELLRSKRFFSFLAAVSVFIAAFWLSFPFDRTFLSPAEYYNLARFHAIQKEPEKVREWIAEGLSRLEEQKEDISAAAYHYHLAKYKFIRGGPLSEVEAELGMALELDRGPALRQDIERLSGYVEKRREGEDRIYMGMRALAP